MVKLKATRAAQGVSPRPFPVSDVLENFRFVARVISMCSSLVKLLSNPQDL